MKAILLLTDFSVSADNALNFAIVLAKENGYKIILLNTWEIAFPSTETKLPGGFFTSKTDFAAHHSLSRLEQLCSKVKAAGVQNCESYSKSGSLMKSVLDAFEKFNPELIIMGTRGAHGARRFFIGSNAARVTEKCACPVIIIPDQVDFRTLKRIMYASDYLRSDIDELRLLVDLARPFNAEIIILHINDEGNPVHGAEALHKIFLMNIQKQLNYPYFKGELLYSPDVADTLDFIVDESRLDLFAISTRKRNYFEKVFAPGQTRRLMYHSKVPLMAFHHAEKTISIN